ncbi:MAG: hypothetical protein AABW51_02905 [Nanoarchaeota archaeon]
MTEKTNPKLQVQMTLNTAFAVDQEIFEKYVGKEVVMDTGLCSDAIGGILAKNGAYFVHLTSCTQYEHGIHEFEEYTQFSISKFRHLPDKTISKSKIEQIVLLEELNLQRGEGNK